MKITADTNLLVRMATEDDKAQARTALKIVSGAERVIVPLPCVLELFWVLESVYRFSREEIAEALIRLTRPATVSTDAVAIDAGLRVHAAGGDFADGVIAAAGAAIGGEIFVSFDRKAVRQIADIGLAARDAGEFA